MNVIRKTDPLEEEEGLIDRYQKNAPQDSSYVWYIDRVTGQEVFAYNTKEPGSVPPLGPTDAARFAAKGLDIKERVPLERCKVKPVGLDAFSLAMRQALERERAEEFARGQDLLVEVDILSYLGLDAALFNPDSYEDFEQQHIVPALLAKGFTLPAFFTDVAGRRGFRVVRKELGHVFYYL